MDNANPLRIIFAFSGEPWNSLGNRGTSPNSAGRIKTANQPARWARGFPSHDRLFRGEQRNNKKLNWVLNPLFRPPVDEKWKILPGRTCDTPANLRRLEKFSRSGIEKGKKSFGFRGKAKVTNRVNFFFLPRRVWSRFQFFQYFSTFRDLKYLILFRFCSNEIRREGRRLISARDTWAGTRIIVERLDLSDRKTSHSSHDVKHFLQASPTGGKN